MQDALQFHEPVVDGVGWGTPLSAILLALLGPEMTLARPLGRMDLITTAEALDLLSGTFGSGLDVPTGLMGTDKVAVALGADPLAGGSVKHNTFGFNVFKIRLGGENGKPSRGEVGIVGARRIPDAQVRKVIPRTVTGYE